MRLTANGIEMTCALSGPSGAPMVTFSHSLATDSGMWEPQAAAVATRYRALCYDTRGHGRSDAPEGPYNLPLLVDDVRALLEVLGVRRTHFVGISMGGMIGQLLALTDPALLLSLVLCDTSAFTPPEARPIWEERIALAVRQGMEPHVEPTIGRWFTPAFAEQRPKVVNRVRAMIRATDPVGYVGCARAIQALDLLERLPAIDVPTLIMVGEDDPGTPVAAAEAIHARIPKSHLVVIESASHLSNLEQSEVFNRELLAFLARVGDAPAPRDVR